MRATLTILALLLVLSSATRGQDDDGDVFSDRVHVGWSRIWGRRSVRFFGDPYTFYYYPGRLSEEAKSYGYIDCKKADGSIFPVPTYVLNLRLTLNAARAYFDKHGLKVSSPPKHIYVDSFSKEGNYYRSLTSHRIELKDSMRGRQILCTPIHEWFHAVQDYDLHGGASLLWDAFWSKKFRGHYYGMLSEGTAEWASDLPIPIEPESMTWGDVGRSDMPADEFIDATTADEIDSYFEDNHTSWTSRGDRSSGLFGDGKTFAGDIVDMRYRSVFFWKFFVRRVGTGEDDLAAVRKIWSTFIGHETLDRPAFVDTLGALVAGLGTHEDAFLSQYEDYVAATIAQIENTGGVQAFPDTAFARRPIRFTQDVRGREHYSRRPSTVPESEAGDGTEVLRRLAGIARKTAPLHPLGYETISIELAERYGRKRAGRKKPLPVTTMLPERATPLYLFVRGPGGGGRFGGVALTHHGDLTSARSKSTPFRVDGKEVPGPLVMTRLAFSLSSSETTLDGRPVESLCYRNFNRGDDRRIWLGLVNLGLSGEARSADYAWAATPAFLDFVPEGRSGDPRTVWFIESDPPRDPAKDSFVPGDLLTIEVEVTDPVHVGPVTDSIDEKNRTLRLRVFAGGRHLEIESERFCYRKIPREPDAFSDRYRHRYRISFRLPSGMESYGQSTAEITLSSLLRLGGRDRSVDRSFTFHVARDRPTVRAVRVGPEDLPAFYDSANGRHRPVLPGRSTVTITFDREMNTGKPAEIRLRDRPLDGRWDEDARRWRGTLDIPGGKDFAAAKGTYTLSIQAEDAKGNRIDSDPGTPVEEPDRSHAFVVDSLPPFAEKVTVLAGGPRYKARWTGGPDMEDTGSWLDGELVPATRRLDLELSRPLDPTVKLGSIYIDFPTPLSSPPTVSLAGRKIEVRPSPSGESFEGIFDVAEIVAAAGGKPVEVSIEGTDRYGNTLDADPGTVARLAKPTSKGADWWVDYESDLGGRAPGHGGPDLWHRIGAETVGEEWIEHNLQTDERRPFQLIRRGGGVQARFGTLTFRGRIEGDRLRARVTYHTLEDLRGVRWSRNGMRINPPPKTVLLDLLQQYGASDRVYHRYDLKRISGGSFQGTFYGSSLNWTPDEHLAWYREGGYEVPTVWSPRETPEPEPETPAVAKPRPPVPSPVVGRRTWWTITHRTSGRLHMIDVHRDTFSRYRDGRARLEVSTWPVSTIRNDRTGVTWWRVQWTSGDVEENTLAAAGAGADALGKRADTLEADGFEKSEIPVRVNEILGPDSSPMK